MCVLLDSCQKTVRLRERDLCDGQDSEGKGGLGEHLEECVGLLACCWFCLCVGAVER